MISSRSPPATSPPPSQVWSNERAAIGTSAGAINPGGDRSFAPDVRLKDHLAFSHPFQFDRAHAPFYRTPTLEAVQGWVDNSPVIPVRLEGLEVHHALKRLTERCENSIELMETR